MTHRAPIHLFFLLIEQIGTECERVTRAVIILALGRTEQEDEHR